MSLDTLEKSSKLNDLIKRLRSEQHEKCCERTERYLHSVDGTSRVTLKNIGCSVECGYSFLTALEYKTLTGLCKYLNLWLDVQRSTHMKGISIITEEQWKLIDKLWNDLDADDGGSKCKRQQNIYNISEKEKHMELFTYCIYRDHIIEMCKNTIKHASKIPYYCSSLSEYTDKFYKKFTSENTCLDNSVEDNHYKYYVSPKCSLYDMPKTFPKFDSQNKEILYENNSREAINKCKNTTESDCPVAKENRDRVGENPAGVVEDASGAEGKVVRPILDVHQARLDDDPSELTKLDPQSPRGDLNGEGAMITTNDGNPAEGIIPPKVGTVGATLAGSSLFLVMMYKVEKHLKNIIILYENSYYIVMKNYYNETTTFSNIHIHSNISILLWVPG